MLNVSAVDHLISLCPSIFYFFYFIDPSDGAVSIYWAFTSIDRNSDHFPEGCLKSMSRLISFLAHANVCSIAGFMWPSTKEQRLCLVDLRGGGLPPGCLQPVRRRL